MQTAQEVANIPTRIFGGNMAKLDAFKLKFKDQRPAANTKLSLIAAKSRWKLGVGLIRPGAPQRVRRGPKHQGTA